MVLKGILNVGDRQLSALGHTADTQKVHTIVMLSLKICRGINDINYAALIGIYTRLVHVQIHNVLMLLS